MIGKLAAHARPDGLVRFGSGLHTSSAIGGDPHLDAYASAAGITSESANDPPAWDSVNWDSVNWDSVNWD